jgi:hypothetical protein
VLDVSQIVPVDMCRTCPTRITQTWYQLSARIVLITTNLGDTRLVGKRGHVRADTVVVEETGDGTDGGDRDLGKHSSQHHV